MIKSKIGQVMFNTTVACGGALIAAYLFGWLMIQTMVAVVAVSEVIGY